MSDTPVSDAMLARQEALERWMRSQGAERYAHSTRRAVERGAEHRTDYGRAFLRTAVLKVADAISAACEEGLAGTPGRRNVSCVLIAQFDPEVAAACALRIVVDQLSKQQAESTTAYNIANRLEDERWMMALEEADPDAFTWATLRTRYSTSAKQKRNATRIDHPLAKTWLEWSKVEKMHVGAKLLHIVAETIGFVEVRTITTRKNRNLRVVQATPACLEWIETCRKQGEEMAVMRMPCVIPPRPWTDIDDGGFWTPHVRQLPLVKVRSKHHRALLREATDDGSMEEVFEAVNILQKVGWSINTRVLDVVETLWEHEYDAPGFPPRADPELPPKPSNIETDEDARKAWRHTVNVMKATANRALGKRMQVAQTLSLARKYAAEDAFWFVYQLDFRGRAYPVSTLLQPQGSDLAKSLLQFSEPMAVETPEQAGWLAINLANYAGQDKASLDDRIAWVEEHEAEIRAAVENPTEVTWWIDIDDAPFCLLAAMQDWVGFLDHGYGYQSRVVVAQDATCSGHQHLAAMSREQRGGELVNLTNTGKREDVYAAVAAELKRLLEHHRDGGEPDWLPQCMLGPPAAHSASHAAL